MNSREKLDAVRDWMESNVLSIEDAAQYLGISRSGVNAARDRGRLKPVLGRMYLRADLERYKAEVQGGWIE